MGANAMRLIVSKLQQEEKAISKAWKTLPVVGRCYVEIPEVDDKYDPRRYIKFPRKENGELAAVEELEIDPATHILAEDLVMSDTPPPRYRFTKIGRSVMFAIPPDLDAQQWLLKDLQRFNLKHGKYDQWAQRFDDKLNKRLLELKTTKPRFPPIFYATAVTSLKKHNRNQKTNLEFLELIDAYFEPVSPSLSHYHTLIKARDVVADGVPTIYKAVLSNQEELKKFVPLMSESQFEAMEPVESAKLVLPETTSESKSTKGKVTEAKDPNVRKRPPTAYSLFIKDFWKGYKDELPGAILLKEASKKCGEKWSSLTDQEKKPYLDKAAELKDMAMECS